MKKFLLFAAALVAVSANAQLASKKDIAKKQATVQQKVALPQAKQVKMAVAGERKNVGKDVFAGRNLQTNLALTDKQMKNLKPAQMQQMAQTAFRRAAAEEYIATGFVQGAEDGSVWQTLTGTSTDGSTLLIKDMIPNPFASIPDGVSIPYTIEGGKLTVAPTLVASLPDENAYVFFCDFESEDGYVRLEIEDDGVIMTQNSQLAYAVFTDAVFDATYKTYTGVVELVNNVKYRRPGDAPEPPTVLAQPANTVLFAGRGATGYVYKNNLALLPGYTEFTVGNGTQDYASAWKWTANENFGAENEGDPDVINPLYAETRNFTINTNPDAAYESFKLVGLNEDVESEEYTWGYGHALNDDNAIYYEAFYGYPGGMNSSFEFSDGSYATMTTQDPDGDLTFYTNWATPDIYTNTSIAKIYAYQGKPAAPIYFTGVTLPLVSFQLKDADNFKLHINVYKCHRAQDGKLSLGDLIAQSDVTSENVGEEVLGVTNVTFDGFYIEDEDGMSQDVDYLQLDDEFVIEITDWDNGTFSAVMGSQDVNLSSVPSAYFRRTGEEGIRRWTTWFPTLLVGLNDVVTGYLYTTDATDIKLDAAGGEATMNVEAMLRSVNSETGAYEYRLFIDEIIVDGESVEEVPEWLSIGIGNVSESGTNFTLGFEAAALPEGVAGRKVTVKFMQEGAFLTVNLTQGEPTGISSVKKTTKSGKSLMYNLAGQRVEKTFKGIVIKDGNKVVVK